jgi:hypothetical protein
VRAVIVLSRKLCLYFLYKTFFMKTNKGLIIGLAVAGAAIAGAVIFLTTTKRGRKTLKTWGANGKKIVGKAEDLLKDARKKVENLKHEYVGKEEVLTNSYE